MRQLGTLPNQEQTRKFVDYLLTEGIATRSEEDGDAWLIWVVQEDDFEKSKTEYLRFQESPDDERYEGRSDKAEELRAEKRQRIQQNKKNLKVVRAGSGEKLVDKAKRLPVTYCVTAICILAAVWTSLGENQKATSPLLFANYSNMLTPGWDSTSPSDAMIDIRSGQYWRLVTPSFVHYGPIHILFNLMAFHQLGGPIETRKGWWKYLLLLLALAVFSNLFQVCTAPFPLIGSVFFGGMSGVVFGLFGYIWTKSRIDPSDRFRIDPKTVRYVLIWFALCFLPFLPVANGGHAGGLLMGIAIAYVSSSFRRTDSSSHG